MAHNEDAIGARGGALASIIAGLVVEVKHDKGKAKQGADGGVNETADRVTGDQYRLKDLGEVDSKALSALLLDAIDQSHESLLRKLQHMQCRGFRRVWF